MTLGADRVMTRRAAGKTARTGAVVALCLLTALALGACGPRRGQAVPVASAADLPATTTTEASTETAALPADAAKADGVTADGSPAAPAAATFQTAAPADPDAVMGLTPTAVQALLGAPGLVRHEAPAEVWQYQSGGCVLDVFLYQASADFQVMYLEARDGQAASAATANCLGAVLNQRQRTPTS